jgi:hypothetical protein
MEKFDETVFARLMRRVVIVMNGIRNRIFRAHGLVLHDAFKEHFCEATKADMEEVFYELEALNDLMNDLEKSIEVLKRAATSKQIVEDAHNKAIRHINEGIDSRLSIVNKSLIFYFLS